MGRLICIAALCMMLAGCTTLKTVASPELATPEQRQEATQTLDTVGRVIETAADAAAEAPAGTGDVIEKVVEVAAGTGAVLFPPLAPILMALVGVLALIKRRVK